VAIASSFEMVALAAFRTLRRPPINRGASSRRLIRFIIVVGVRPEAVP
jgi:hypothetical protein